MNHSCKSKHCDESFNTARSLATHRARCEHYKHHEATALERRKEAAKEAQIKRAGALGILARAKAALVGNSMMQVSRSRLKDNGH